MSPWMNTDEVAEHLRYTGKQPLRSVYKFIKRHGIVPRHDGGRLLLARADVDAALEIGGPRVRHTRKSDVGHTPSSTTEKVLESVR